MGVQLRRDKSSSLSCRAPVTQDFMKMDDHVCNSNVELSPPKDHESDMFECRSECIDLNDRSKLNSKSREELVQAVSLFRKHPITTTESNNAGKTEEEKSQVIDKRPPRALVPPKGDSNSYRSVSFLEQRILPASASRIGGAQSTPFSDDISCAPQLTIFYAGAIHVYDNVPVDKAQAIILLASESSSLKPAVKETQKIEKTSTKQDTNFPGAVPLARRLSLLSFLEKRRDRISCKSPYNPPSPKRTKGKLKIDDCDDKNHCISLSHPYPS